MRNIVRIDPKIRMNKLRDFIDEPFIITVNDFDEEAALNFEEDMDKAHDTQQPVIPIVINSFGGSVYALLSMVSSILSSKVPVATIVKGKAMSCGAILFGFGTEGYRFIDPEGVVMIHDAACGTYGKVQEVKADAKHLEMLNEKMYKKLAKHIGHDENYFLKEIEKHKHVDWYLSAKEAKKHKLANHIRVPEFRTEVVVNTVFE